MLVSSSDLQTLVRSPLVGTGAQQAALAALQRGEILPLARIMAIATSTVPGDIIEIEYKAGPKYEVKILSRTGRVIEMKIDARTGEILAMEDD